MPLEYADEYVPEYAAALRFTRHIHHCPGGRTTS
jgi:hypothetical protein